jgi:hypothetical protein
MTAAVALPLEKTLFIDIETAPLWRSVGEMREGENDPRRVLGETL